MNRYEQKIKWILVKCIEKQQLEMCFYEFDRNKMIFSMVIIIPKIVLEKSVNEFTRDFALAP